MPVDPFLSTGNDARPKDEEFQGMSNSIIDTTRAPAAIGPYSQAVRAGSLLFVSGQIPLDPNTMELVGPDLESQTRRVLENLKAVLAAAGCSFASVTKTTIYLTDLADFAEVNRIYGEYFELPYPARATVGVAALPRNSRVEIDAIAVLEST
jgi:reactive intermediate/imine deaminase